MILNFYTVLKRVRALVGSANMRLQFEKLDQPRTDGKTIYVPNSCFGVSFSLDMPVLLYAQKDVTDITSDIIEEMRK